VTLHLSSKLAILSGEHHHNRIVERFINLKHLSHLTVNNQTKVPSATETQSSTCALFTVVMSLHCKSAVSPYQQLEQPSEDPIRSPSNCSSASEQTRESVPCRESPRSVQRIGQRVIDRLSREFSAPSDLRFTTCDATILY
jgi:hypothetical protein